MYMTVHIFEYISWMLSYAFKTVWTTKKQNQTYIKNAHIKSVNFWESMVVFSQHLSEKFEFYEYKMHLDGEIVAPI